MSNLTGKMRVTYPDGRIAIWKYSMTAMCNVILNGLTYELEGRDY
jgi:hypothetical protein